MSNYLCCKSFHPIGADGEAGQRGLAGIMGENGEPGIDGIKGEDGPDGKCQPDDFTACNCDTHTLVIHSQTTGVRQFSKCITSFF